MCRWLKLSIHKELHSAREAWTGSEGAAPVELEVEGGIIDAEHPSISAEAEREATNILQALMEQKNAERRQHMCDEETNAQVSFFIVKAWLLLCIGPGPFRSPRRYDAHKQAAGCRRLPPPTLFVFSQKRMEISADLVVVVS